MQINYFYATQWNKRNAKICKQLKVKCKIILLKTLENWLNKSYFMTYHLTRSLNHFRNSCRCIWVMSSPIEILRTFLYSLFKIMWMFLRWALIVIKLITTCNDSHTLDTVVTRDYCTASTNEQYHKIHATTRHS